MSSESYLPGFETHDIETAGARIYLATGGSGPKQACMVADRVAVMRTHVFKRFAVVKDDRSGRVAHRRARGPSGRLERIAVLDVVLPVTLSAA